ncbi:MAG TPA: hypothetical protein DCY94_02615 [Firmicutes bacterium]|nr:hypothetical protein [Bacillota bacterium]
MKVSVSILKTPYSDAEAIKKINETDAEYLHVDVLDGHFIPGVKREYEDLYVSKKMLDVHLMVSKPFAFISKYALKNTKCITLSAEIDDDLDEYLDYIKSLNIECGLAIKPSTRPEEIEKYLEKLDKVTVLTVEPGASFQSMIMSSLYRIDTLVNLRKKNGYKYEIWVDGGVNGENISKLSKVDGVVSGGFVVSGEDFQERIDKLRLLKKA